MLEWNEMLHMSAVRRDLDTCYSALQQREVDLQGKVVQLAKQAVSYKQVGSQVCLITQK